jgi:hypothetical protein
MPSGYEKEEQTQEKVETRQRQNPWQFSVIPSETNGEFIK